MESIAVIAAIVALVAQFGAVVWGASKLSANLDDLKKSVDKLTHIAEHLDSRVDEHEVKIKVIHNV